MMNESENRTRTSRSFGVIRHTLPEMTPTEKAFLAAFVVCGLVAAIVVRRSMSRPDEYAIAGFCGCVMGPVLCYWMRQEPAAFLQLFVFPFTGWQFKWPTIVLMCVRGFGIVCFFGCLASFPLFFLPASWANSSVGELVILALAVSISVRVLRKRSRSAEPETRPERPPS
jgi:hypothetical protein